MAKPAATLVALVADDNDTVEMICAYFALQGINGVPCAPVDGVADNVCALRARVVILDMDLPGCVSALSPAARRWGGIDLFPTMGSGEAFRFALADVSPRWGSRQACRIAADIVRIRGTLVQALTGASARPHQRDVPMRVEFRPIAKPSPSASGNPWINQASWSSASDARSASTGVRYDREFKCGDPRKLDAIGFDLASGVWWNEVPLLADDLVVGPPAVARPPQDKLLRPRRVGFEKWQPDAAEPLRPIEPQADRLLTGLRSPATHVESGQQRSFDRIGRIVRGDLDPGQLLQRQPGRSMPWRLVRTWLNHVFPHGMAPFSEAVGRVAHRQEHTSSRHPYSTPFCASCRLRLPPRCGDHRHPTQLPRE